MSGRNVGTLYVHVLTSSCLAAVFSYLVYAYESGDGFAVFVLMLYGFSIHVIQSIHGTEDRAKYHGFLMGGEKLRSGNLWGTLGFSFAAGVLGLGGGILIHSTGFDVASNMHYVVIVFIALLWAADCAAIIRAYRNNPA